MSPVAWTAVLAGAAFVGGVACFVLGSAKVENLGVGLLTGTVAALGIVLVQVNIDDAQDKQKTLQEAQTAEQTFHLSLALTSDLTGFDPRGHALRGEYLSGKTLNSAQLDGAHLEEAQLRGTHLRQAQLTDAHLKGANLRGADLTQAILTGADLTNAHLEGARFGLAAIEHAKSLRGATVDHRTCWPEGFLAIIAPKAGLEPQPDRSNPQKPVAASMGHTCEEG